MEYQIVTANDPIELSERVRELIKQGWSPIGGVSVTSWLKDEFDGDDYSEETRFTFCQAMTRSRPQFTWDSSKMYLNETRVGGK